MRESAEKRTADTTAPTEESGTKADVEAELEGHKEDLASAGKEDLASAGRLGVFFPSPHKRAEGGPGPQWPGSVCAGSPVKDRAHTASGGQVVAVARANSSRTASLALRWEFWRSARTRF